MLFGKIQSVNVFFSGDMYTWNIFRLRSLPLHKQSSEPNLNNRNINLKIILFSIV